MPISPLSAKQAVQPVSPVFQKISVEDVKQLAKELGTTPTQGEVLLAHLHTLEMPDLIPVLQEQFKEQKAMDELVQLLQGKDQSEPTFSPSTSEVIVQLANELNLSPVIIAVIAMRLKSDTIENVAETLKLPKEQIEKTQKDLSILITPEAIPTNSKFPTTKTVLLCAAAVTIISASIFAYRNRESIKDSSIGKTISSNTTDLVNRATNWASSAKNWMGFSSAQTPPPVAITSPPVPAPEPAPLATPPPAIPPPAPAPAPAKKTLSEIITDKVTTIFTKSKEGFKENCIAAIAAEEAADAEKAAQGSSKLAQAIVKKASQLRIKETATTVLDRALETAKKATAELATVQSQTTKTAVQTATPALNTALETAKKATTELAKAQSQATKTALQTPKLATEAAKAAGKAAEEKVQLALSLTPLKETAAELTAATNTEEKALLLSTEIRKELRTARTAEKQARKHFEAIQNAADNAQIALDNAQTVKATAQADADANTVPTGAVPEIKYRWSNLFVPPKETATALAAASTNEEKALSLSTEIGKELRTARTAAKQARKYFEAIQNAADNAQIALDNAQTVKAAAQAKAKAEVVPGGAVQNIKHIWSKLS